MKKQSLLIALLCLGVLSACSSSSDEKEQARRDEEQEQKKSQEAVRAVENYKPKLICPQVAVIRELQDIRDYGGGPSNPNQLVAAARMKNIEGDCSYHDDGIDITFKLNFIGGKGPHLTKEKLEFPYFIAVIDPNEKILNKNEMTATFKFEADKKNAEHSEPLHVFIPLTKEQKLNGPNYRVLAGFQLTQQQLLEARGNPEAPRPAR